MDHEVKKMDIFRSATALNAGWRLKSDIKGDKKCHGCLLFFFFGLPYPDFRRKKAHSSHFIRKGNIGK